MFRFVYVILVGFWVVVIKRIVWFIFGLIFFYVFIFVIIVKWLELVSLFFELMISGFEC